MKCTSTTGPLLTLRSVFPPSAPVSPSGLKPSSRFFLSPGSWVCGRAGVRAELFRKSAPDLRVAQPLHIQPRQLRGDLLWPQGKEEHSPAQRQPALLPPGPPAGAQRHPHTVWRAAIARGQVKTEGRQEHTAATEGRQRLRFEVFSQILTTLTFSMWCKAMLNAWRFRDTVSSSVHLEAFEKLLLKTSCVYFSTTFQHI